MEGALYSVAVGREPTLGACPNSILLTWRKGCRGGITKGATQNQTRDHFSGYCEGEVRRYITTTTLISMYVELTTGKDYRRQTINMIPNVWSNKTFNSAEKVSKVSV